MVAGEGKKAGNFGLPTLRAHTLRAPFFLGWACRGHTLGGSTLRGPKRVLCLFLKKQENTETVKLAKVGLAKVGHPNFGQSQSIKVGQSRSNLFWPKSVWGPTDPGNRTILTRTAATQTTPQPDRLPSRPRPPRPQNHFLKILKSVLKNIIFEKKFKK